MYTPAKYRFAWIWAVAAMLLAFVPATSASHPIRGDAHSTPPQASRLVTRDDVAAFADAFFAEQMTEQHMPGATLAVVKDGAVLYTQGYGYANLERQTPVIAETTIFHTASVSKVFTASAVMQLVEQGKLALDADVNTYLREFQIPATFPQPITIAHLLTHTAGFDEEIIGLAARSEADRIPLSQFVRERIPVRVRAPGELCSYSNYGFALLGYVVEVVSGVPYTQYMADHILQPLGMQRSGFKVRPNLTADVAVGYRPQGATLKALPFPYVNTTPASELTTTATDMTRFMLAQLGDGSHGAGRLLQESTLRQMQRQHFTHHPRLIGMAYGFHEYPGAEHVGLGHSGGVNGFSSLVYLLPEDNLGLFVVINREGAEDLTVGFVRAFLAQFYPRPSADQAAPAQSVVGQPTAAFQGTYRRVRSSQTTLNKLVALMGVFGPDPQVTVNADGTLRFGNMDWVPVEPLVYQSISSGEIAAFRQNSRGEITHLLVEQAAFFKTQWYDTTTVGLTVAAVALVIFLVTIIGWPLLAFIRRQQAQATPDSATPTLARWLAWILCVLNLVCVVCLLMGVGNPLDLLYGLPPLVSVALNLTLVTVLLTIPVVALAVLAWRRGYWSIWGRAYYTLVAVAGVSFVWFLNQWNLLGVRL